MRINQNIAAFNSYRNLSSTGTSQAKSLEKLSSGFRINRAGDDAAGLVKSETLRAEIGGTRQAITNAQDGISFVQTAEGALNEVHSILQRMRELSVSAANRATSDGVAQQAEITELTNELTAIGNRTTFSGRQVFNNYNGAASGTTLTFHIGAASGANNKLNITTDLRIQTSGASGVFNGINLSTISVTNAASVDTASMAWSRIPIDVSIEPATVRPRADYVMPAKMPLVPAVWMRRSFVMLSLLIVPAPAPMWNVSVVPPDVPS